MALKISQTSGRIAMGSNVNLCTPRMILVPEDRWNWLRQLEKDMPALLEKAKEDERKEALERLHKRDKDQPELARKRAMKRYNLNKEEIKQRRREAYQRKKEAKLVANSPAVSSPGEEKSPDHQ